MYSIRYKNSIIYDPRLDELKVVDPKVTLAVNKAGAMGFTLLHNHPLIQTLKLMHGIVELRDGNTPIYRGRIVSDKMGMYKSHRFETEGMMACLNDSLVPPFKFPEDFESDPEYQNSKNRVEYLFRWAMGIHNDSTGEEQQLKIGRCTVTDPNNYISRSSSEYMTTMDFVREKLSESSLGGFLLVRYEPDGTYLDYLKELPLDNTQQVEYGVNLLDLADLTDGTQLFTAILPIGKDGLTIEDLPDGDITDDLVKSGKVVYSKSGVSGHGRITKLEKWPDITLAENLQNRSIESLSAGILLPETISCTALDLGWQEGVQHFRVGRMTALFSLPHGYQARYPLMALSPDILHYGQTKITLGGEKRSYIGAQHDTNTGFTEDLQDTDRFIEELASSTSEQLTEIIKNAQMMMSTALADYVTTDSLGNREELLKQTIMKQTAESITLVVNQTATELAKRDGEIQSSVDKITKYFDFTENGLYIGEEGNILKLRLDNDVLEFLRNNAPMLRATDRGLYVPDEINSPSHRSGAFAWGLRGDGGYGLSKG